MNENSAPPLRSSLHVRQPSFPLAERSHSGLVHRSRKPEWSKGHRGFESHPLRHFSFQLNHLEGSGRVGSCLPVQALFATWRRVGVPEIRRFPFSRLLTASLSLCGTPCA